MISSGSRTVRSFKYAIKGLSYLLQTEHNAKVHCVLANLAIAAGFLLNISLVEWIATLITIGMVISLEAINSSIEKLSDFISPGHHQSICIIKDLAAGAVLFASIIAAIIGTLIFLPKVIHLIVHGFQL